MKLDSITIKNLRNFVEVVENNGVKEAVAKGCVTRSTVYGHIKWLEEKTECKLFYEIINRRNLTPEGRELYAYASKILNIIDNEIRNINLKR